MTGASASEMKNNQDGMTTDKAREAALFEVFRAAWAVLKKPGDAHQLVLLAAALDAARAHPALAAILEEK